MWSVIKLLLGGLGGGIKSVAESTTARMAIAAKYSTTVIVAAMSHRIYWVVWGSAAGSMAFWFVWGMLDTTFNGALPDVAQIPPGLKPYADIVWSNIFWTGVTGYGISTFGSVVSKLIDRITR